MRSKGHDVFIDVNSITIGDPWARSIEKNISECDIFVVILTPDALSSSYVEREILQAQKQNKIIVPCIHQYVDYNEIKWGLADNQGIEFSDKYELALNLYPKIKNYKHIVQEKQNNVSQQKPIKDTNISEDIDALNEKGNTLFNQRKYEEAIEYYDKALAIDPNNKEFLNNKANALDELNKYEESIHYYDKALAIDPNYTLAKDNKKSVLEKIPKKTSNYDHQSFHELLENLLPGLKGVDLKNKKDQETIESSDKFLEDNFPGILQPPELDNTSFKSTFTNQDYSKALSLLEKAIDIEPYFFIINDPSLEKTISNISKGNFIEAINHFNEALQKPDVAKKFQQALAKTNIKQQKYTNEGKQVPFADILSSASANADIKAVEMGILLKLRTRLTVERVMLINKNEETLTSSGKPILKNKSRETPTRSDIQDLHKQISDTLQELSKTINKIMKSTADNILGIRRNK
jgi:tetratricopeptide (TPR) repeat protein